MTHWPEHLRSQTTHARRGSIRHAFTHDVDFVLIDPDASAGPALFARNRAGLYSVQDRHHGGAPGKGRGVAWAREVFAAHGLTDARILLLTQPAFLGRVFNPVSQAEKFDPQGDYIRRWIPELRALPQPWPFKPWEAPSNLRTRQPAEHYPAPLVDLRFSRERALRLYQRMRQEN